jgi:hypothetical protein
VLLKFTGIRNLKISYALKNLRVKNEISTRHYQSKIGLKKTAKNLIKGYNENIKSKV